MPAYPNEPGQANDPPLSDRARRIAELEELAERPTLPSPGGTPAQPPDDDWD